MYGIVSDSMLRSLALYQHRLIRILKESLEAKKPNSKLIGMCVVYVLVNLAANNLMANETEQYLKEMRENG